MSSRPRSSSDPSENKAKAPLAPSLGGVSRGIRAEVSNWGKKSSSGYVGLSNQGATCYLNSLLQCLYMTPEFRHSLFTWKYKPPPNSTFDFEFMDQDDDEDKDKSIDGIYDAPPEHSIPFQLQCLFARLHRSCRGACSTKALTKSFHWEDGAAFQQHDVQELLRVLFDAVSRALSKVGKGNLLNDLCKGLLSDYLDCQVCHSDRARQDIFLDLSLTIEGINSLEDAIRKFITPEQMTGGNQVNCYKCDQKQDFNKGLKFKKLPPLLIIQLKRFHYDWALDRRIKLSHKVSFPKQLDMAPFIDENDYDGSDNKENLKYKLYGVIIQSGGALGGHYFANIKSFDDDKWYRFNDSSVRELDEEKEFEDAFGGESVKGTGYVLLYRQCNLKLPDNYEYFPKYLTKMIEKEDENIKIQWEQWQKDMRTITVCVTYPDAKPPTSDNTETQTPDKNNENADPNSKDNVNDNTNENENEQKEKPEVKSPIHKISKDGKELTLKLDVEEYTFDGLLKLVRRAYGINDEELPLKNSRLRKYHLEYNFLAEGYDDDNIQESKIEIAKWPKNGLNLMLETKEDINTEFEYFNPDSILIQLFVVTDDNTPALVDRGFVESATFKTQELPPGDECSVIVDSKAPLTDIKKVIFQALKEKNIIPKEWLTECENDAEKYDPQQLNLIKFDYNRIRLFNEDEKCLNDYHIKLGTLIFVEKKSKDAITYTPEHEQQDEKDDENADMKDDDDKPKLAEIPLLSPAYQRSKLAVLYEEQRLKISVQFNDPLPSKSVTDRVEEILMTPEMLGRKRQLNEDKKKKRLEFSHALRISKECSLKQLKTRISAELQLDMSEFRLRKSSSGPELRDMKKTLNQVNIMDGGLVYVEYGVPTGPKETCITFSLYDVNKLLTDPHKKKKTLAKNLFEYPFKKDIKVSVLKKEIVKVINRLFPLYRDQYNFIEAIKVLKQEEKERNEKEIEDMKKATELSKQEQSNGDTTKPKENEDGKDEQKEVKKEENGKPVVVESKTDTQSAADVEAKDKDNEEQKKEEVNAKRLNIFGIEHVRLRKQRGAKVLEMLFDDRKLSNQIMGNKDSLNLVIEKIPIKEHFTKNHLCFWLQKYRCDVGKSWNGKVFKKKEFVIDKNSKIIELKRLIASLLKKSSGGINKVNPYLDMSEEEIIKNISITKGLSTSPMTPKNINSRQWVHRAALHQIGIDPDKYFYKLPDVEEDDDKDKDKDKKDDAQNKENATKSGEATKDTGDKTEDAAKGDDTAKESDDKAKSNEETVAKDTENGDAVKSDDKPKETKDENTTTKSEENKPKEENNTTEKAESSTTNGATATTTEIKSDEKEEDKVYRAFNGKEYKDSELVEVMQRALLLENEETIGRPPFHLRNGDLIVWTDIRWKPNENQIEEKKKIEKEKRKNNLKQNPNFKKGTKTFLQKFRREPQQLKIRTYEEYLEDERKKKEEEEKQKLLNKDKENNNDNNEDGDKNKDKKDGNKELTEKEKEFNSMIAENIKDIENPKPIKKSGSI